MDDTRPIVFPIGFDEQLQPQASPVSTYVRPAQPPQSSLLGLADALSGFSHDLSGFMQQRQAKLDKRDQALGEAAGLEANGEAYAEAVRQGKVATYNSPTFVQSFKQAQGSILGKQLASGALDAYQTWPGRNDQDPTNFDSFLGGYIKQHLGTINDPDVLNGALPYVRSTADTLYQANEKERSDSLYAASLNTHIASSSMDIDNAQDVSLTQSTGLNYDGLWQQMMADRQRALASGIKADDYDKSMTQMIQSKALEYADPGMLGLLKNKVPGQPYSYADTVDGEKGIDDTLQTMESRQAALERLKQEQQDKADKAELQTITGGVVSQLAANPNAIIDPATINRAVQLGDGAFAVQLQGWRKTLATPTPAPEDPASIMAIQQQVLGGADLSAITDEIGRDIHDPKTVSSLFNLYDTVQAKSTQAVMGNATVKRVMSYLQQAFPPQDLFANPDGITPDAIQAQTDFTLAMADWYGANPNASYTDIASQATKVLKDMQTALPAETSAGGGSSSSAPSQSPQPHYVRPEAITEDIAQGRSGQAVPPPALTPDAETQLLDNADAAAHQPKVPVPQIDPWKGDKPPTLDQLTPEQQQKVNDWAAANGVDPQKIIDRTWQQVQQSAQPEGAPSYVRPPVADGSDGNDVSDATIFRGVDKATLPAGMRNDNPGNIKYTSNTAWRGEVGPSTNTDQGDPQVVFASSLDGMRAAARLAIHKFDQGKTTIRDLIAGTNGWTPGYLPGAEGVAKAAGIGLDDPLNLRDPAQLAAVLRGIVTQEHGPSSRLYSDALIRQAVSAALS